MLKSTSYYLRYKKFGEVTFSFVDCKSLKTLEKEIKKMIDLEVTFEVWVKFNFTEKLVNNSGYGFNNCTSFEIWHYDSLSDTSSSYNLRKNMYYKKLRRYEKRLRPLMLSYGVKGKGI
jgi:hypothetical protein